jgi:hypothetical protein
MTMRKTVLIALLIVFVCRPAPAAPADPRDVLREAFERSPAGFVKIHAAEALLLAGESTRVRDAMAADADKPAGGAPLGYRIGVWRVLAAAANDDEQRASFAERIRDVALDAEAPDRLHAIESLAKLGWKATGEHRQCFSDLAKTAKLDEAPMVWWLLAVAGSPRPSRSS